VGGPAVTAGVERGYEHGGFRVAVSDGGDGRGRLEVRRSLPIARCHPERQLYSAGKCEPCYRGIPTAATVDEDVARELAGDPSGEPAGERPRRRPRRSTPTTQELRVMALIRDGATNKEAAAGLEVSEQTIKNHMTTIMRKLGAKDRTHAIVIAVRLGFLEIEDGDGGGRLPLRAIANELNLLRAEIETVIADVQRTLASDPAPLVAQIIALAEEIPAEEPAAPAPGPCETAGCSNSLPPYTGRGRPRTRCLECRPARAKEAA
jgi:DNA-binding CsgD family transcriptional regulator